MTDELREKFEALKLKAAMRMAMTELCPGHIWSFDYKSKIDSSGSCVCKNCGLRVGWDDPLMKEGRKRHEPA